MFLVTLSVPQAQSLATKVSPAPAQAHAAVGKSYFVAIRTVFSKERNRASAEANKLSQLHAAAPAPVTVGACLSSSHTSSASERRICSSFAAHAHRRLRSCLFQSTPSPRAAASKGRWWRHPPLHSWVQTLGTRDRFGSRRKGAGQRGPSGTDLLAHKQGPPRKQGSAMGGTGSSRRLRGPLHNRRQLALRCRRSVVEGRAQGHRLIS